MSDAPIPLHKNNPHAQRLEEALDETLSIHAAKGGLSGLEIIGALVVAAMNVYLSLPDGEREF